MKKFNYIFLANLFSALCKFLVLIVLARLGSPIEVGKYNYALVISAPIFLFLSLKIRSVIVTNDNYKPSNHYSTILTINSIAIIFLSIIALIIDSSNFKVLLLVSLIKIVENLKEIAYGIYQKDSEMKYLSMSMISYNFFSFLCFSITFYLTKSLESSLILWLIIAIVSFYIVDKTLLKKEYNIKLKYVKDYQIMKEISLLTFPLSLSTAIGSLNTGIPRILVKSFHGEYYLGVFSAIAYLLVVGNLFANSISQIFLPQLRNFYRLKNYEDYRKTTKKMMFLGFIVGIVGVFLSSIIGKTILKIVFGNEYANNSITLVILSFGLLFILSGVFLGTSIIATGNYKVNYKISLITLFSTIISSIIFIPRFGLIGTAITISFSQLITLIAYYYFYKKVDRS